MVESFSNYKLSSAVEGILSLTTRASQYMARGELREARDRLLAAQEMVRLYAEDVHRGLIPQAASVRELDDGVRKMLTEWTELFERRKEE